MRSAWKLNVGGCGTAASRREYTACTTLLGHESIQTTGDVYTDWDIEQLAETLRGVLDGGNRAIIPHGAAENAC